MSGIFYSETKPKFLVLLFLTRPILLLLHVVSSGSDSPSLAMLFSISLVSTGFVLDLVLFTPRPSSS